MINLYSVDPKTGSFNEVEGMADLRGFLLKEHNDDGSHGPIAGDLTINGRLYTANAPRVKLRTSTTSPSIPDSTGTLLTWGDPLAAGPYGISLADGGYQIGTFWSSSDPTFVRIPYTGLYLVSYSVNWAGNATGQRTVELIIGPADVMRTRQNGGNGSGVTNVCTEIYYFVAGQALQVMVTQNSGGALTINGGTGSSNTWLQLVKLG